MSKLIKITAVLFLIMVGMLSGGIPVLATQLNNIGCGLVRFGYSAPAKLIFSYVAMFGDANAYNNLGVLYWRDLGVERSKRTAMEYFQLAIFKGNLAARYNYADALPNRFETPLPIIKEQISLLERNIAEGDEHSNALLARKLYFANRSVVVPNREARKLEILETAAKTEDRDYIYLYGKELWDQARRRDDSDLALKAIPILKNVVEMGEPRAADILSMIRRHGVHWIDTTKAPEFFSIDYLYWKKRAADMGLMSGKCGFGIGSYHWLRPEFASARSWPNAKPPKRRKNTLTKQQHEDARKYLIECANAKKTRRKAALPFGSPALYAYKRVAVGSSLVNSPLWAKQYIGLIYLEGIGTEPNIYEARRYFQMAREESKNTKAQNYLDVIDKRLAGNL